MEREWSGAGAGRRIVEADFNEYTTVARRPASVAKVWEKSVDTCWSERCVEASMSSGRGGRRRMYLKRAGGVAGARVGARAVLYEDHHTPARQAVLARQPADGHRGRTSP